MFDEGYTVLLRCFDGSGVAFVCLPAIYYGMDDTKGMQMMLLWASTLERGRLFDRPVTRSAPGVAGS